MVFRVSTQKPAIKPLDTFDQSKLEQMVEPFTVRVERVRNQTRTPIPMPSPGDGGPPGSGFTKDLVMSLETWLVTEWCGGGVLSVTVTDADQPKPTVMRWQFFSQAPEKVPPPLAGVLPEPTPPPVKHSAPAQQQVNYMPPITFPNGLPPGVPSPTTGTAPPVPNMPYYGMPYPFYQQPTPPPISPAQQAQNYTAELQNRINEMQRMITERDYEAKRQAHESANNERMRRLEDTLANFGKVLETSATRPTTPTPNAELEALKLQLAAAERAREEDRRRAEEERREREAKERDRELREEMRREREASEKRFEAMMAQMNATANKGPDPMFTFMLEQMRMQSETQKEIARSSAQSLAEMKSFMLNPRELAAITRETTSGVDQVTQQIARSYAGVLDVQSRVMDNMAQQLGGGGKSGLDLVDGAMERLTALAESWTKGKSMEERYKAQAAAEVETARARAIEAQANVVRAQYTAAGAPPAGLAGATPPPTEPTRPKQPEAKVIPIQQGQRGGRTEEEWFGVIFSEVGRLRESAARAIESISAKPPRLNADGTLDGATPQQAAMYIIQAADFVKSKGIPIPALVELYDQQRWADFVDLVFADSVPQGYKDQVIQALVMPPSTSMGDDDEDEDDDEEAS